MSDAPRDRAAHEVSWQLDGRRVAGQCWGEPGQRPLLALHGWLDNSASFARLAPDLAKYHVVAPDLCGHGYSDHRSADGGYQIWDDLADLERIVDALGWETFYLVGHSRGAVIASLLASVLADRVERLVLLDGLLPPPLPEEAVVEQMRRYLEDRRRLPAKAMRTYPDIETAVLARKQRGITAGSARLLVERNLRPVTGGYRWRTDPRLQGASAMKLTAGQSEAVVRALTMPTLILLASDRLEGTVEFAGEQMPGANLVRVEGNHHFHMDGDIAELVSCVESFLQPAAEGTG